MKFECLPGCSDCCGPVPLPREYLERFTLMQEPKEIIEYGEGEVLPLTKDFKCVFLNRETNKCTIYEHRPDVCRKFGVSKDPRLQCPHLKPSGRRRSAASKKQVMRRMDQFQGGLLQIGGKR